MILTLLLMLMAICSRAQPSAWIDKIDSFDWLYSSVQQSERLSPGLGNGYIGTTAFSDSLFVAGVYNGKVEGNDGSSHRARVPSTLNVKVESIDGKPVGFVDCAIDMEFGRYIEHMDNKIERIIYVHREHKHLLVHQLKCMQNIKEVCVRSNPGGPSVDINFTKSEIQDKEYGVYSGWTQITEWETDPKLHVVMVTREPKKSPEPKLGEVTSWSECFDLCSYPDGLVFHTILADNLTTEDAIKEYEEHLVKKPNDIMETHIANWNNLRKEVTSIKIDGYPELARVTNSSIYELLISMNKDVFWSSSPGGLTTNSYNGHVFWDFETWMYPPLLVMHPVFAKNGLQYRLNHIKGAYKKAIDNNYTGAMWPWESSYSGDEVTPKFAKTGEMEHHISGDIVFAARQYDYLHRNQEVRKNLLCPLAIETAKYWASRLENGTDGLYHIRHIIPPDEYAEDVDDNIYTNDIARISLLYGNECEANASWVEKANKIYREYDEVNDFHPEFTGYNYGRVVKQADVILISFPLGQKYNTSTLLNNLFIYENVTDIEGPAMTWSMFFVNYLELASSMDDIVKATRRFLYKSFSFNVKGPFLIWWEAPSIGAIHFATGAGGFLQAFIFGYAGLRIHYDPEKREILARLKPFTTVDLIDRIEVCGIHLLEGKVKIDVRLERNLTFVRTGNNGLYLNNEKKGRFDLKANEWVKVPSNIALEDKDGFYLMMDETELKLIQE